MIRFFNGRTLTMADGVSVTTDEVWTDGDKIAYIGPTPETLPAFERQIDLGGDLVMPGFKNAHAHAGMSFVRSYADDVPLQPWLFEQIFPLEAKLTPEAVYAFTKLSILEYLTSGITAGFDMYYFREAIAQASIDCGFRTVLCGGGGSAQQLESEYRKFNALHPLISYQLGLHSEYTSNLTEMTEAGELARALHAPVFAHNAETAREVAECRGRWGKTPTELFDSLGHFDYGGGGFHCVHMTEHDLEIFRNRGLWAVTNPGSNAKLASGIAPLKQMRALGIHMAIGTDGVEQQRARFLPRDVSGRRAAKTALRRRGRPPGGRRAVYGDGRRRAGHGPDRLRRARPRQAGGPDRHRPAAAEHAASAQRGAQPRLQRLEGECAPDDGRRARAV